MPHFKEIARPTYTRIFRVTLRGEVVQFSVQHQEGIGPKVNTIKKVGELN